MTGSVDFSSITGGSNWPFRYLDFDKWQRFWVISFLSDPSPIIGYPSHELTDCGVVDLIDAYVDIEKSVDNSLVQIWKLKFGHKAKFLLRL